MKRFLSQRQNKWLLLAALNKGERNMISYEVGKRYDAAIRGEGTQFDLADDLMKRRLHSLEQRTLLSFVLSPCRAS